MQIHSSDLASRSRKEMKCDPDGCCERSSAHISCLKWLWRRPRAMETLHERDKNIFISRVITSRPRLEQQQRGRFLLLHFSICGWKSRNKWDVSLQDIWKFSFSDPRLQRWADGSSCEVSSRLNSGGLFQRRRVMLIWPSGSIFSRLLSCCCHDKENDPWRSRQHPESNSTRLSSVR